MSQLTAIVIYGTRLYRVQGHYRKIIEFLHCLKLNKIINPCFRIEEYLFIDFNKKIILNNQSCFDPKRDVEELKDFIFIL